MPRLGNGRRSASGSRLGVRFAVSGSEKDVNSPGLGRPPICVRPRLVDSQACRAVATRQATIRRVRPLFAAIRTMGLHPLGMAHRDIIDRQPSNPDYNPDCHRVRSFLPSLGSLGGLPRPISAPPLVNSGSACSAPVEVETQWTKLESVCKYPQPGPRILGPHRLWACIYRADGNFQYT